MPLLSPMSPSVAFFLSAYLFLHVSSLPIPSLLPSKLSQLNFSYMPPYCVPRGEPVSQILEFIYNFNLCSLEFPVISLFRPPPFLNTMIFVPCTLTPIFIFNTSFSRDRICPNFSAFSATIAISYYACDLYKLYKKVHEFICEFFDG